MRYLLCLILSFSLSTIHAQSALDNPVTLRLTDVPLEEALLQLGTAAEVNISFSPQLLISSKTINAKLQAVPLQEVLHRWLKGTDVAFSGTPNGIILQRKQQQRFTVSGYLTDATTGERLIGANIYETHSGTGVASNSYGFYSQQFPQGKLQLQISYLGYQPQIIELDLQRDTQLPIELTAAATLVEVVIMATNDSSSLVTQSAATTLPLQWLSHLPATAGEADVLRSLQLLPGVQNGADGFGGLHVRGGSSDQNLILLDDVPIYNPSHTFGLFSIFNPDLVKNVRFYKSGFPARYDGRISSVLDIRTREGSEKERNIALSVGTIAARALVELPFKNQRGGLLLAGRRSHVNGWLGSISEQQKAKQDLIGAMQYNFADVNLKAHYSLSKKDKIYASLYWGRDRFQDESTTIEEVEFEEEEIEDGEFDDIIFFDDDYYQINWGNRIASLRWNHLLNDKLFSNTTLTASQFNYSSLREQNTEIFAFDEDFLAQRTGEYYSSEIVDYSLRTDFDYFVQPEQRLRFGAGIIQRKFTPGLSEFEQTGSELDSIPELFISNIEYNEALETTEFNLYVEDEWNYQNWTINGGLRWTAARLEDYTASVLQPRLSINYHFNRHLQFNTSATRTAQFLHLLTRSDAGLPNDLWVAASENVPYQRAWQTTASLFGQIDKKRRWRVEGYWKNMQHLYRIAREEFQQGVTSLEQLQIDATNWELFVEEGTGHSAGIELMLEQQTKHWTAWASYAYAKTTRQFGEAAETPYSFDTRHSLTLATTLRLTNWLDFAVTGIFQSGRPFAPTDFGEDDVPFLDVLQTVRLNTNEQRLPVYQRVDVSFNIELNQRRLSHQLQLGVYNALNRKNVLFAYGILNDETGTYATNAAYGLPILPSLSYQIKF
ncbi:MAG: carboxypeptidase-like regulatory domain-containing protein [Saprospiraceae bacterium]